jgi:hypothetical protein
MKISDLKEELINKLNGVEDIHIIKEMKMLLEFELEEKVYELSESQKIRIQKAKTEYLNSEILDSNVADGDIEKWLNEK